MMKLFCKKITLTKSREMATGWSNSQEWTHLAESSKEGCGSKKGYFLSYDDDDDNIVNFYMK
jgi:hypothetical protein